jgi:hypothetical protein
MPQNSINYIEITSSGSYVDITLPAKTKQFFITSKDFSSDFYIRKKGETEEKFIPKEAEYSTPNLKSNMYLDDSIFQIKGTGDFVIEYTL